MDTKFCLKGTSVCFLADTVFRWPKLAGNFPAEEPDPDRDMHIPIDFLVRPFLLKCRFSRISQWYVFAGIKGQPCRSTGDRFRHFVQMLQPSLGKGSRLLALIWLSDIHPFDSSHREIQGCHRATTSSSWVAREKKSSCMNHTFC